VNGYDVRLPFVYAGVAVVEVDAPDERQRETEEKEDADECTDSAGHIHDVDLLLC
jgi:hypothetical protein